MAARGSRGRRTLIATVVLVSGVLVLAALQPRWLERALRQPLQGSAGSSQAETKAGSRSAGERSIPVIVVAPPRSPAGGEDHVGSAGQAPAPTVPSRSSPGTVPVGLAVPPVNRPASGAVADRTCTISPGGEGSCGDPCQAVLGGVRVPDGGQPACMAGWLANIDAARASEGVGPMVLPSNFVELTPAEQLLVVVNLERTARGLPPMLGLTEVLDQAADRAVALGRDPSLPGVHGWRSVWAGGHASVLGTLYGWMYDDGWGGPGGTTNVGCSGPSAPGCWGHRRAILGRYGGCQHCLMGAGWAEDGAGWQPGAWAAVFVRGSDVPGVTSLTFSWAAEVTELPACERNGDTC
jgi:hypothetical protein